MFLSTKLAMLAMFDHGGVDAAQRYRYGRNCMHACMYACTKLEKRLQGLSFRLAGHYGRAVMERPLRHEVRLRRKSI